MLYRECPYCGAALDPGETCDCDGIAKPAVPDPAAQKENAPLPRPTKVRYTYGSRPERRIYDPNCPAFW